MFKVTALEKVPRSRYLAIVQNGIVYYGHPQKASARKTSTICDIITRWTTFSIHQKWSENRSLLMWFDCQDQ